MHTCLSISEYTYSTDNKPGSDQTYTYILLEFVTCPSMLVSSLEPGLDLIQLQAYFGRKGFKSILKVCNKLFRGKKLSSLSTLSIWYRAQGLFTEARG